MEKVHIGEHDPHSGVLHLNYSTCLRAIEPLQSLLRDGLTMHFETIII